MKSEFSYKAYRELLKGMNPPAIPYLCALTSTHTRTPNTHTHIHTQNTNKHAPFRVHMHVTHFAPPVAWR